MSELPPLSETVSPLKGKSGVKRLWAALHCSSAGLRSAFLYEDAFRLEVVLAAILIPLVFFLSVPNLGRALMIAAVLLVMVVELINSAIEATVDRISLERHPLAKRAKDIGSAAVLIALLNVILVWGLVLLA